MSGAARVNTKLEIPKKYEAPTTISVNLKKHPSMDGADVGKKVRFKGHGVVRSIRKDDYGHHMEVDVHHMKGSTDTDNDD